GVGGGARPGPLAHRHFITGTQPGLVACTAADHGRPAARPPRLSRGGSSHTDPRHLRRETMNARWLLLGAVFGPVLAASAGAWPQWRGPNRDAVATDFTAPKAWPKELTKKWSVPVGGGVATPALAGGKLYVFSWEDPNEVTRCLDANTGKEVWKDSYKTTPAS